MADTGRCTDKDSTDNILPFLSNFIVDTCRIISEASLRLDEVDYVICWLNSLELMLNLCSNSIEVSPSMFSAVSQAKDAISNLTFDEESTASVVHARKLFSGDRGRPRFLVTKEQLEFINCGFHCPEIGKILGISESTVRRRLKDFGISAKRFTRLTDRELDCTLQEIKRDFPDSGYRMVLGQLRARNIYVQENRVQESLRRVDMEGVIR